MGKGRSVQIIIPDGSLNNTIKITMPSWDGIAFRLKRKFLATAKDIPSLKQCGVYFLYGEKRTDGGAWSRKVYVGQGVLRKNGEGVFWRIKEHDTNKEAYWTDAIAFVDSKNEWGKTETSYLENRFANLALNAKRHIKNYEVVNGNEPNPGNVTQFTQWALDAYIEGVETILQVLGYDFFIVENSPSPDDLLLDMAIVSSKNDESANLNPQGVEENLSDIFPFKVGRVMSCAFREALATGLLSDELEFLESEDASKLFKTRGNKVISRNAKMIRDSKGKLRFADKPILLNGEEYWLTTQIWKEALPNLLKYLEKFGMSRKRIEELCRDKTGVHDIGSISTKQSSSRRPNFRFSMIGVVPGAELVFNPTGAVVTVCDDSSVSYHGTRYKLSAFAKKFMPQNHRIPSDAYQGAKFFSYQGRILDEIRTEMERNKI